MLQKLALCPLLNICSNLTRKKNKNNCNTLRLNVYVKSTLSGTLRIQKALHLVYNSSRPSMERLCVRAWERYSEGVSEWSLTDVMVPQRSSYLGNAECLSTQAEWEARRVPRGCQSVAHALFFHALPPSLLRSLWIREEEWDWERTRRTNESLGSFWCLLGWGPANKWRQQFRCAKFHVWHQFCVQKCARVLGQDFHMETTANKWNVLSKSDMTYSTGTVLH